MAGRLARTAGAIALVPLVVLAALAAFGLTAPVAAMVGMIVCGVAAVSLAAFWLADLDRLEGILYGRADASRRPRLPPLAALADAIDRIGRVRTLHQAAVDRRRQADEAIVTRLPDPLIVLAADRSLERLNQAASRVFGNDVHALLRHPTLRAAIDRAALDGSPQTADLSLPVPVARELHATVIRLDGGAMALAFADHTRARAVERMREDFVANASHELRTPLTSLIGFIETLRGPALDDPPAQQRFLLIMAEQAARMNRLIDDLLSLSRIELSEHRPPSDLLALEPLIRRVAAGFEPRLAERGVTMTIEIDRGLARVVGDADQLEQVLQNLFENAVKYGREGGNVAISAGPAPGMSGFPARPGVVIAVRDEGQGIAKIHLSRLTERFYRVDKGRSRAAGGTGLGLAIVKHIINRHRGQLIMESEVGKGSVFTVWLPLAP